MEKKQMLKTVTVRDIQLEQLKIFKEFIYICKKNKLQFFLTGGTLLGAVRHKGFIPWDDDLDVAMLRDDYEKFCKIAQEELPDKYFFQTFLTDKNYPYAFAKIRKKGTSYLEAISEHSGMEDGLFIDILPYDCYPDNKVAAFIQGVQVEFFKHVLITKSNVRPWIGISGTKRVLKFIEYISFKPITCLFSHDKLAKMYNNALKKYNTNLGVNYYKEPDLRYGKVLVPKSAFVASEALKFEDIVCPCPSGYHDILTALYGDYMILPPEDKRGNWHHVKQIKL